MYAMAGAWTGNSDSVQLGEELFVQIENPASAGFRKIDLNLPFLAITSHGENYCLETQASLRPNFSFIRLALTFASAAVAKPDIWTRQ